MEISFFCENRDYLRVKAHVPVRYRFLADHLGHAAADTTYEGTSRDLSGGGILLRGEIPEEGWIPDLLMERITLDLEIFLPDESQPVKAIARAAWLDTGRSAETDEAPALGLKFVEITREAQDRVFQYILHDLLP